MVRPRYRRALSVVLVGVAAFLTTASAGRSAFLATIEGKSWDWRVRHLELTSPPAQTALVLIDEPTLKWFKQTYQIRWPLPRDTYCPVLAFLRQAGAKAVVFDVQFSEPDVEFDEAFAQCLSDNGKAVLAWQCQGDEVAAPPWTLPLRAPATVRAEDCKPLAPMPVLAAAARGGGRVDMQPDSDGVLRAIAPLVAVPGDPEAAMPTLGRAALALESTPSVSAGRLRVGGHALRLGEDGKLLLRWRGEPAAEYSFKAVHAAGQLLADGKPAVLPLAPFRDRIVLIAASAAATFEMRVTPVREADLGAHAHIALIDALQSGLGAWRWPEAWDLWAAALLALLGAALTVLPPRLWQQFLGAFALLAGWLGWVVWQYRSATVWVGLVTPTLAVLVAAGLGTLLNYALEGRERARIRHAFTHYLAPEFVELLVRDPSRLRLGGERREITAFFSDIQGFTTISEKLDPAVLVALLNECLSAMTEIILSEGGIIDKYIGDAIVAIFGAPLDQPDHATRAVRAALRCQAKLVELRVGWAARGLPELRMRIGLNSGVAVVGNMGSQQRFDYTMMGDTVNLAARLEGAASVYGVFILVGEETLRRAADGAVLRELDWLQVKGKKQPVAVATPLAMRPASDEVSALAAAAAEALAAYRRRDFAGACAQFSAILARWPGDAAAEVFLARATAFAREPPPPEWRGVHELTSK